LFLGAGLSHTSARNIGLAAGIILGIIGTLMYYFGLADLAQAKGYSGAIVVAIIVLGLCVPLVSAFIMTPVVLFALKDKTAHHRRHHSRRSTAPLPPAG
jgi:amino acid transporter